jgi:hypothetical protein
VVADVVGWRPGELVEVLGPDRRQHDRRLPAGRAELAQRMGGQAAFDDEPVQLVQPDHGAAEVGTGVDLLDQFGRVPRDIKLPVGQAGPCGLVGTARLAGRGDAAEQEEASCGAGSARGAQGVADVGVHIASHVGGKLRVEIVRTPCGQADGRVNSEQFAPVRVRDGEQPAAAQSGLAELVPFVDTCPRAIRSPGQHRGDGAPHLPDRTGREASQAGRQRPDPGRDWRTREQDHGGSDDQSTGAQR